MKSTDLRMIIYYEFPLTFDNDVNIPNRKEYCLIHFFISLRNYHCFQYTEVIYEENKNDRLD